MRVWLIDVVPYKGGALVLAAAHNQAVAVEVHFGLGALDCAFLDNARRNGAALVVYETCSLFSIC